MFKHTLKTALIGLRTNRVRSFLTVLGIVIGVTSIMLIMSLGKGAQNLILSQVQGMGSKTIVVIPGREPKGPSDAAQIFSDSLKERDADLLRKKDNVPNAVRVMPLVFGGETGSRADETYRLTVFGGSPDMEKIFDVGVEEGVFISEDDIRSKSDSVVIGSKVKEELFGEGTALGEKIKIKDKSFRVVGILPKKGQVSFFNFDEVAIIPHTTAQQYVFGIKHFHRIIIEADSEKNINRVVDDATATLREAHKISDPSKDDFFVQTQADIANRLGLITQILTIFLALVAAISLVVGGIGIMNIMLVSVTERTREIGLRKALGATEQNILSQFLLEAVLLTGLGGLVGVFLGTTLSLIAGLLISQIGNIAWPVSFPWMGAFLGITVSAAIGLVFGIYPAKQASRKSPMEALRYE